MQDYASLKTEVAQWLNREGMTSLTDKVDTFLAMAQRRIFRDMNLRCLEATATGTLANTTLPATFQRVRSIYLTNGTTSWPLKSASPHIIAAAQSATTAPKWYEIDGDEIRVAPSPDADYAYTLKYYQSIPLLSGGNITNWFTANAPELILFGALLEASVYLKDDQRTEMWRSRFEEVKKSLQDSEDNADRDGGGLQVVSLN